MGELEELILGAVPSIEALIPAGPAAELGRHEPRRWDGPEYGTPAQRALNDVPGLTAERLLGALELGVAKLTLTAPDAVVSGLRPPPEGGFGFMSFGGESALKRPVAMVAGAHPGAIELITEQVRTMAALLDLGEVDGDEAAVIAKHGAAHLALAVATSAAILRKLNTWASNDPLAVIGIAIGVTALVLPEIPKPRAYTEALLQKRRDEYKGMSWSANVPVSDHQFQFAEEPSGPHTYFVATGLAAAIDTGFAVRTGIEQGEVPVSVRVVLDPPGEPELRQWDEVADISFTALVGDARLGHGAMPPWPGDFRVRVSARGRDGDDEEAYELLIWPEHFTMPWLRKGTDVIGHRLRGEPEPVRPPAPEAGLRWLEELLGEAATVTVITGLDVDDVVDDFEDDSIAVEIDGGVVVVEDNNYVGSKQEVLERLSRNGKAASFFWNVNAHTDLSFARDGVLIASEEPWEDADFGDDPEVVAALDGLDFGDYRHTYAKGITAVTRFTGGVLPQEDLTAAIEDLYE
ncbi:DUF6461 domain-containing protein [Lentzea sp. NPDC051838]|uniref:DUF6461 domain-containing protein n=1 Tax=Lentzea sp. NPDC051838 TaxID=3154849 RepID=UPI00342F50F0